MQNHALRSKGHETITTWSRGAVALDHIGIWEKGGVEFERVFEALDQIGYTGYVTVHQAFGGVMPVEQAVQESAEFVRRLGI